MDLPPKGATPSSFLGGDATPHQAPRLALLAHLGCQFTYWPLSDVGGTATFLPGKDANQSLVHNILGLDVDRRRVELLTPARLAYASPLDLG